jgi:tetratricopeptide (TPR) repeat protein
VKVIASTSNDVNCLPALRSALKDQQQCFVEMQPLSQDDAMEVLRSSLARARRTLSEAQMAELQGCVAACTQPLYLALIAKTAQAWRSFSLHTAFSPLPHDPITLIQRMLRGCEASRGPSFVSAVFAYLSIGREGFSMSELGLLLSRNAGVMDELFQHWVTPDRTFPAHLLCLLVQELGAVLQEDDTGVLRWHHRQFHDAATAQYVDARKEKVQREVVGALLEQLALHRDGKGATAVFSLRRLATELPQQLVELGETGKLRDVLLHVDLFELLVKDMVDTGNYDVVRLWSLVGDTPEEITSHYLCRLNLKDSDLETARLLHEVLGQYLYDSGFFEEAEKVIEHAERQRRALVGDEHTLTADSVNFRGMCLLRLHHEDRALEFFRRALSVRERVDGGTHVKTLASLNNVAIVLRRQGHFEEALRNYERALSAYDPNSEEELIKACFPLNNMAALYSNIGNYKKVCVFV